MTSAAGHTRLTLLQLTLKTVVVHTVAAALYPLRSVLFGDRRGWLILWWLLLALGVLSTYGVNHPGKRWLDWTSGVAFSIVMLLPLLGLFVER